MRLNINRLALVGGAGITCAVYRETIYCLGEATQEAAAPKRAGGGRLLDACRTAPLHPSLPARAGTGSSGGRRRTPTISPLAPGEGIGGPAAGHDQRAGRPAATAASQHGRAG